MRITRLFTLAMLVPLLASLFAATANVQAAPAPAPANPTSNPPFFVHYYLWWTNLHWHDKLGPNYPFGAAQPPLPATMGADGCSATSLYPGNQLLDIPQAGLYTQDDPATFDLNIQQAAAAGIQGFVVSWAGLGTPDQTPDSYGFNRRLKSLASRVAAFNAGHANKFYLMVGYDGASDGGTPRSAAWIQNDWNYFLARHQNDPVFQVPYYGSKPVLILENSWRFSAADVGAAVGPFGSRAVIVGDEHGLNYWNRGVSPYFAGASWYWSAQDPYTNPQSFSQIAAFAAQLHAEGKLWFAPMTGGFNTAALAGGSTCIPRNNGETIQRLYDGNKGSNPNGWFFISWNEYFENTYLEPSARDGSRALDVLHSIIAGSPPPPPPTPGPPPPSPTPGPPPDPCRQGFSDVTPADYFYTPVQYLTCHGAISGYSDGTFRPGANTTRGQLAKIIVLAENWSLVRPASAHFTDVPATSPFYPYVETAYAHGIISGYGDGSFRPGANVTRGQLSKIIVLAQGWATTTTGGPHFTDIAPTNPFYGVIETAYAHGIISGYSNQTFRPGNNATRGQIAKMIYNAVTAP
jgi:hypothetical protein